ncbi:MAG: hypothetical protein KIT11_01525 [Fimbriimonadaceae bacterium]|nr:hypothetical protein [Fimbriimonadaceae bacterium]
MNPGSHSPHTHDMSDEHDYRFDAESYDAAASGLSLYEDDFRSFRELHNDKPASWWDPGKVEVERRLEDLRRELDEMRHTAPDAWGENRDHFAKGMQELTQAYGQNIREIRRKA